MNTLPESQHIPAGLQEPGVRTVARAPRSPVRYLQFDLITVTASGTPVRWASEGREAVLYLIGGTCEFSASGPGGTLSGLLDTRSAIFDGPPAALYLPPGTHLELVSPRDGARLALFSAPPAGQRPLREVHPDQVSVRIVGRDAWSRRVCSVVDQQVASRLLVGETINQAGSWSSYPPHKHDTEVPGREVPMEEIYHFMVRPPEGFGLQMVYTAPEAPQPFEHIYRVRDGDTVVIPRGYHPVVAAGGYQLAYLWAISGDRVDYGKWCDDPAHTWLLQ
ncbi:MAG: 5-deoxy-glucuronate isomerase [Armatimonadota bacterium]|nr:5-deoxy-glucuronate isomerase [Armatimonadota bacterium]